MGILSSKPVKSSEDVTAPRRSKRTASSQAAEAPSAATATKTDGNHHKSCSSNKRIKLSDLPADALSSIAEQTGDFQAILGLANADGAMRAAVIAWQCAECNDSIFVPQDDDENKLTLREGTEPFICVSCEGGKMYCGRSNYKKGYTMSEKLVVVNVVTGCASYKCRGCERMECETCNDKNACAMCIKYDSHCNKCRGKCGRRCNLCGCSICDKHGAKCDKCGYMTCGDHDFSVDTCSYCGQSLCDRCHDHGHGMLFCGSCKKISCNANGDGNNACPKLENFGEDHDWPKCEECTKVPWPWL